MTLPRGQPSVIINNFFPHTLDLTSLTQVCFQNCAFVISDFDFYICVSVFGPMPAWLVSFCGFSCLNMCLYRFYVCVCVYHHDIYDIYLYFGYMIIHYINMLGFAKISLDLLADSKMKIVSISHPFISVLWSKEYQS